MSDNKYIKGPFKADFHGGYVFSGPDNFMFAQVRGWGALQYKANAETVQDENLQFLVDALNEKAQGLSKTDGPVFNSGRSEGQSDVKVMVRKIVDPDDSENLDLDGVLKKVQDLVTNFKRAGDEIADLAHPEFGEVGRLQEEIHELKKELDWLTFYKREVYQCLGAGVDDVNTELRAAYIKEKGLAGVPEKLRKEYLDYEADHGRG
jgi:hypothetical protein